MLSCKEVQLLVSQAHDRKLSFSERIGMKIHLLMCKVCARYRKQLDFIANASRQMLKDDDKGNLPRLSEESKEKIQQVIDQQTGNKV